MSETVSPVRASLPSWLKVKLPQGDNFRRIKAISERRNLHTVCEEARCPNIAECWGGGTATFMVMGDACTRGCRFCSVASQARPAALDPAEPQHLAETLCDMRLEYAVITTVCRDDMPDQGASHLAKCIRAVKSRCPNLRLEILLQDFRGEKEPLKTVIAAKPDILAHNLETIERLTGSVRDARAGYKQSLEVLRRCRILSPGTPTKSSLMLGLGETEDEIIQVFKDLRRAQVDILTLGQYLRPTLSAHHLPVREFISPQKFDDYGRMAREIGFLYVASGPFVRSSYRAGELFLKGLFQTQNAS